MAINSKNTKAEILAAYKEIEKQKKSLESELKNAAKIVTVAKKPINPAVKHLSPVNKNNSKDIANTIDSLSQIQGSFGGAVSNLSEQLIERSTQLEKIKQEIALEKFQLKELYDLEKIEESTIDNLIEQYQINAKKFAEELSQKQEEARQEIETLDKAWSKEQEAHIREIRTRDEEYRKTQQRAKEEYEYNLDLARDLDEEEYYQEKKSREEELELNRQALEKLWSEKEIEIVQQEREYTEAKDKVTAFESQLCNKIKQGKEEGKGIGAYQAKVKANLRSREIEGQTKNYELRIESLEQTIRHQGIRISKLSEQLDASLQQVQDLAVKAIEGSSNRNSFEAMKAIALEQAKTQSKGK